MQATAENIKNSMLDDIYGVSSHALLFCLKLDFCLI
jgi:hypothetical protein